MELLAPAGNVENFRTALEAGADAVYVGAPGLNARNLARDLSLDEIAAMIRHAHGRGKKVYIALNSLARETDLSQLVETLCFFEWVGPDGLIVQDLGAIELVTRYFPDLKLHASTLMAAHNRQSIDLLGRLGCSRVVLARELTIKEIAGLTRQSRVEIEVFVHGAMCFSYSGLCLFSSYLGGKSGLRGNCVQPCRRKFTLGGKGGKGRQSGKKSGYFFSMNDLQGLELVPDLKQMGIHSLKIEGRLRSANYVRHVVGAYRLMLDAPPDDCTQELREASAMISAALGRRTSTGYFLTPKPKDALTPQHSGNIGSHLGRIESFEQVDAGLYGVIALKQPCEEGERLRLHFENSGDRLGFTLKEKIELQGDRTSARFEGRAKLLLPDKIKKSDLSGRIEVYRVDEKRQVEGRVSGESINRLEVTRPDKDRQKKLKARFYRIHDQVCSDKYRPGKPPQDSGKKRGTRKAGSSELWLQTDSPHLLFNKPPFQVDRYIIELNRSTIGMTGKIKNYLKRAKPTVIWALPSIVHEGSGRQLQKDIKVLVGSGFRNFQISHLSQVEFFKGKKVSLFGDYHLNLLNSRAMILAWALDLQGIQMSIEADRVSLETALRGFRASSASNRGTPPMIGLTVFGAPPLFTSRMEAGHFSYGRTLVSPKNEPFVVEKAEGVTRTRARQPFSLLQFRDELAGLGFSYFVINLSGLKAGRKEIENLAERVAAKAKVPKLSTFNYLGNLE